MRCLSVRFPTHRVAGGSYLPPAPTERGGRMSRTTLFRHCLTAQRSSLSVYTGEKALVAATDTHAESGGIRPNGSSPADGDD